MRFNFFFLLFLCSCANSNNYGNNNFSYSASGFAYIEKNIPANIKDKKIYISHNKLIRGTKIRITNPDNGKFIETTVDKKIKYDFFFKVLISLDVANELELDTSFPYVKINEIKKNKSFIAKKAITENVEKKIANTAPVEKINISNLSKEKKIKKTTSRSYSILVAEFYNLESAQLLKKRLITVLENSNYQMIYINKKSDKSYELLMGPYNTINKLKNDYTSLYNSNFEDLDIKIND